ncbi:MAG: transposon-transfer assisting family protein [Oscillospiraceae bacterium]|nr:transposon-transfer assisting family protein [Oscillospiraceae bacterium]
MNTFTHDEINLMCIYNTGTRQGLIDELTAMRSYLAADENRLRSLTDSALEKLCVMSDDEFTELPLYPDFEE